jgi:amino acid adenylation domain-containing protein
VRAVIGALKAGIPFSIFDPAYPHARLVAQLEVLRPAGLIHLQAEDSVPKILEAELLRRGCRVVLNIGQYADESEMGDVCPPSPSIDAHHTAYILFTSGTTGVPKGVDVPHHALPHFLKWYASRFKLHKTDRFSMLSGLSHDMLLRDIFGPLTIGATLHIPEQDYLRKPDLLNSWLRMQRITVSHVTPSLCRLLCSMGNLGFLPDLRYVFSGGETLYYKDVYSIHLLAPHAQVVNCYGATETPQFMAFHAVTADPPLIMDEDQAGIVPLGTGIADAQLLVITPQGQLATQGELGEIHIRSRYLSKGYLSDSELTSLRFVHNCFSDPHSQRHKRTPEVSDDILYRTGDMGRYDDAGIVHYVGRADNQVKVRGFRVELEDIESAISVDATVARAAVVCIGDTSIDKKLVACIQPGDGYSSRHLRHRLERILPDYMVPAQFIEFQVLPLTPNGKVDRAALIQVARERPRSLQQGKASRNEVESAIATIWEELLGVRPIGIDEDFVELGGHSLLATVLLNRIEKKFGSRLRLSVLIEANTIEKLAIALTHSTEVSNLVSVVPLRSSGTGLPAYWIPGGGGLSVLAFRRVSSLIDANRPIYGLESSVDLGGQQLSIQEKAALYLKALRKVQPSGPYTLMGFSAGSWLAYEMALQLTRLGEIVGRLIVFDAEVPNCLSFWGQVCRLSQVAICHLKRLWELPIKDWKRYLIGTAKQIYWDILRKRNAMKCDPRHSDMTKSNGQLSDIYKIADNNNRRAVYQYAHSDHRLMYSGLISVVVAKDSPSTAGVRPEFDPRLGWKFLTTEGMTVHSVPGDHLTMLEYPNIQPVAATLSQILLES